MTAAEIATLLAAGLAAGAAIGAVGIGGVILVPLLVGLARLGTAEAIAAAEFGYVVTGLTGLRVHLDLGTLRWRDALPLTAAAAPAAALGALLAPRLPATALGLGLAALMVASGLAGLRRRGGDGAGGEPAAEPSLAACGLVTGFASALTGTGGPAVLLPLLTVLRGRITTALALAQVVQLPIAGAATLANLAQGTLRWPQALVLAAALAFGARAGGRLAGGIDAARLQRWICLGLIAAGMLTALRLLLAGLR